MFDAIQNQRPLWSRGNVQNHLGAFGFSGDDVLREIHTLSGGERARMALALMTLAQANLLVLDEPTNDLDIATLNVLEQCLKDFAGAVILVTHDRYFLDQVTTQLLAFPPIGSKEHKLTLFSDFNQWEEWLLDQTELNRPRKPLTKIKTVSTSVKKVKLTFREQNEFERMEETIHQTEEELRRLAHESALPENTSNPQVLSDLSTRMAEAQIRIDRLYDRWAELEKKRSESV
jgi:ATP-binding cassette subfamily F protein uup